MAAQSIRIQIDCKQQCKRKRKPNPVPIECEIIQRQCPNLIEDSLTPHPDEPDTYLLIAHQRRHSCRALEFILNQWRHIDVGYPRQTEFCFEVALVLFDLRCLVSDFQDFATSIRLAKIQDDLHTREHVTDWAFIAVVFGWKDVFFQCIAHFREEGNHRNRDWRNTRQQEDRLVWDEPLDTWVLRDITTPTLQETIQLHVCNVVTWYYCELKKNSYLRKRAERITNKSSKLRFYDDFEASEYPAKLDETDIDKMPHLHLLDDKKYFAKHSAFDLYRHAIDRTTRTKTKPNPRTAGTPAMPTWIALKFSKSAHEEAEAEEELERLQTRLKDRYQQLAEQGWHAGGEISARFDQVRREQCFDGVGEQVDPTVSSSDSQITPNSEAKTPPVVNIEQGDSALQDSQSTDSRAKAKPPEKVPRETPSRVDLYDRDNPSSASSHDMHHPQPVHGNEKQRYRLLMVDPATKAAVYSMQPANGTPRQQTHAGDVAKASRPAPQQAEFGPLGDPRRPAVKKPKVVFLHKQRSDAGPMVASQQVRTRRSPTDDSHDESYDADASYLGNPEDLGAKTGGGVGSERNRVLDSGSHLFTMGAEYNEKRHGATSGGYELLVASDPEKHQFSDEVSSNFAALVQANPGHYPKSGGESSAH